MSIADLARLRVPDPGGNMTRSDKVQVIWGTEKKDVATTKKAAKKEEVLDLNKLRVPHELKSMNEESRPQKLFIPACGDRLVLSEDWTFTLYLEHRNTAFAAMLGLIKEKSWSVYEDPPAGERHSGVLKRVQVTLPAGLVLECDRVYIRTFNTSAHNPHNDYDSITWKILKNGKPAQKLRFWCKLVDACEIEYELQFDSLYRDRVKLLKSVHEA
jgi:hypothetical protein